MEIKVSFHERCFDCMEALISFICQRGNGVRSMEVYKNSTQVFFHVDKIARKVFPATFMLLNLAYWTIYVYIL